jgi:bifunctional DNA primase/polymerase-like protein/AAA domain-containing protein
MMLYALKYAADGFPVFPVYEPSGIGMCSCEMADCKGKHPRTPNGCTDATTDIETIKGWWKKWPKASIGMPTGKRSGVGVVDLDGVDGMASGRAMGISSSVTALTGSGRQLFFSDPSGSLKNSAKKFATGMDTRGEGGYCVMPPSIHPNGKRYCWQGSPLNRKLLPNLPAMFVAAPAPVAGTNTLRKPADWIADALEDMRKGHVHNTLISVLGKFRTHNFSEEDTYRLLQPHALLDGRPYEGLRAKISEIWRRYQPGPAVQGPSRSEAIDVFLDDIKEVNWICKPFVAKKSIGFVAGLPETLKTWLCTDLAVECAREYGLWLGLFPVTNCKVLFIDQERWKGETQRRFSSVLAAKGLIRSQIKENLYLKSGTTIRLNIDSSFQAFRTELLEMRPEMVIVDSFATFHTSPENDRTEIQKVLERIKELRNEIGCTFVFINHETKYAYPNGEEKSEPNMGTMAGSVAIGAAAEFCLIVRKVEDNTSIVHHVKSTLAQKAKAFYASVVDVPEGIVVRGISD